MLCADGALLRAFSASAKVANRCCSRPLQRVVTDFGADVAFAQVVDRLAEHYGVLLSESTIRRITQAHAGVMQSALASADPQWPQQRGVEAVIAQMDGTMVPVVDIDNTQTDRRRGRQLRWQEAKISLSHVPGSRTLNYGGTVCGSVARAGQQWLGCALTSGLGTNTLVHAVGDGAEWIATQCEQQFGANGSYLIDFYHLCSYLSEAAKALHNDATQAAVWLDEQKLALKQTDEQPVLAALKVHLEATEVLDADAPIRRCYRYMANRAGQFAYRKAIAAGRPIGSGEIESAHRYVVQQRLKRPGAWWTPKNAERMLALRLVRANRDWKHYWASLGEHSAHERHAT